MEPAPDVKIENLFTIGFLCELSLIAIAATNTAASACPAAKSAETANEKVVA